MKTNRISSADCSRAELEIRYRRLQNEILEISKREQQRIGQDLHDDLCQQLTGITLLSEILERKLSDKSLAEAADAAEIHKLIADAIIHTRRLAKGLLPLELESHDLMSALEDLASNTEKLTHISCRMTRGSLLPILDRVATTHLYRIAQEAVHNAVKHARAKHILIRLIEINGQVVLSVTDDGIGLQEDPVHKGGLGIFTMNNRAETINATFQIRQGNSGGTVVTCSLRILAAQAKRSAMHNPKGGHHEKFAAA